MADRTRRPVGDRFWEKVDRRADDQCWEWQGARLPGGYGVFGLGRTEGNVRAHRFAWESVHGPIPAGLDACHHCDNPPCVNPAHLFLGTRKQNMEDMAAKGRSLRGERHNLAELSEADVLEIRRLWADGGLTQAEIAARFDTNKANVSQIVRGKKWRHLLPVDWTPPSPGKWSRP